MYLVPVQHPSPSEIQRPPPDIRDLASSLLDQQRAARVIPDLLRVLLPATKLCGHPQVEIAIAPCERTIFGLGVHPDRIERRLGGRELGGDVSVDGVGRVACLDGLEDLVRGGECRGGVDRGEV
jgi:hypothetical protein